MARVSINETILNNIAEALRNKLGVADTFSPQNMASTISNIEAPNLMEGNIITNGEYYPSGDKNGFSKVIVNVPQGIAPAGNINITTLQSVDVSAYATAQVVDANIIPTNIKKDVNILGILGTYDGGGEASAEILTPDYNGLSYGFIGSGQFQGYTSKTTCLLIYECEANETYVIYKNDSNGNRFRAGFFSGKTLSDFTYGINNPSSGLILAGTEIISQSDNRLYCITYTPPSSGVISIGTSAEGVMAYAGCIKI